MADTGRSVKHAFVHHVTGMSRRRRAAGTVIIALLVVALIPPSRHAIERALHIHQYLTGTACNQGSGGASTTGATIGMAASPDTDGYWLVRDDGGVFVYGDATPSLGSANGRIQTKTVGMAATPSGRGYWIVERRGMVWAFGDAGCYGGSYDTGATDIVGIASSPDGRGYVLVEQNGGTWTYGDAVGYGCIPCQGFTVSDVIGIAETPGSGGGSGYWIAEANGGVWPYGNACGCGANSGLAYPITAIITPPGSGQGYFLIGKDGGVFVHGTAQGYLGSEAGRIPGNNVTAAALTIEGHGMWFALSSGTTAGLGDAAVYQ